MSITSPVLIDVVTLQGYCILSSPNPDHNFEFLTSAKDNEYEVDVQKGSLTAGEDVLIRVKVKSLEALKHPIRVRFTKEDESETKNVEAVVQAHGRPNRRKYESAMRRALFGGRPKFEMTAEQMDRTVSDIHIFYGRARNETKIRDLFVNLQTMEISVLEFSLNRNEPISKIVDDLASEIAQRDFGKIIVQIGAKDAASALMHMVKPHVVIDLISTHSIATQSDSSLATCGVEHDAIITIAVRRYFDDIVTFAKGTPYATFALLFDLPNAEKRFIGNNSSKVVLDSSNMPSPNDYAMAQELIIKRQELTRRGIEIANAPLVDIIDKATAIALSCKPFSTRKL